MTQCSALNNALQSKGWTAADLAGQIGLDQQRVSDIVAGKVKPSESEFNSIRGKLGLSGGSFAHVANA